MRTTLTPDASRTVISRNDSPDVPFDRSVNPYRGCEHGCIYCYARPTHAYLGLSPGLDFESRLFYKPDAADQLRKELSRKGYQPAPLALGANTDPYQPVERRLGITRSLIEVLSECNHPLTIITKSALVERDLDLLAPMAERGLCSVSVSVTTRDHTLARRMEPRATSPTRRLEALRRVREAGIPAGVLMAPIIPFLNDAEIDDVLSSAAAAGAIWARYSLLRLPLEIAGLFREWATEHYPDRAQRIMERIRDSRGGKDYESTFGERMRGTGIFAELIASRFAIARRKHRLDGEVHLDATQFRPPSPAGQLALF